MSVYCSGCVEEPTRRPVQGEQSDFLFGILVGGHGSSVQFGVHFGRDGPPAKCGDDQAAHFAPGLGQSPSQRSRYQFVDHNLRKKKQKWQGSIDPVNFFSLTVLCFREKKMTNSNLIKTIASTFLVNFLRNILSLPPIILSVPSAGVFYRGHFPTFFLHEQAKTRKYFTSVIFH